MALIEVKHVTKHFGPKVALDDVSIDIPEGKIFGLLGPNGAGKSTLIRIINRITMATGGEVWFNGRPITDEDVAHIGYLPEERGLYRKMKVGDQAMYLWNKKVEELSKGMAQKVQFITTVVHKPSLMILDEPFSGFDPVNADLIRKEILRLKEEGATIILSTHNMESVEELCDEIALINKARLVVTGGTDDIRHRFGEDNVEIEYTEDFARKQEVLTREKAPARLTELIEGGIRINAYRELVPRMNDIFIKLVTETEGEGK